MQNKIARNESTGGNRVGSKSYGILFLCFLFLAFSVYCIPICLENNLKDLLKAPDKYSCKLDERFEPEDLDSFFKNQANTQFLCE